MRIFNSKFILSLIILLALFLRAYNLAEVPSGVHTDEQDTGYSAYSILRTGLDPQGKFSFFGFSDNNVGGTHPPIYTYFLLPLISSFGLNVVVERMPSVIYGIFSVMLVYFIAKKLFNLERVALMAAFLMSVNPWAIHISRQGLLEAGSIFFVLLAVTFFLYLEKNKYFLIFSALSFGASFYSYQAPRIFVPFFLVFISYYKWEDIKKIKKYFFAFVFLILIFYFSILSLTFFGINNDYNNRFLRSAIFSSVGEAVNNERYMSNAPLGLSSIFHNKITNTLKRMETSYSSLFSLNWLFINGDGNLQQSVGRHGQFYLFELPFFFMGIYWIFLKNKKTGIFLIAWMMLGAIPGGLTTGNYPYRSVHVLPVPLLFSSFGIVYFWDMLKNQRRIISFLVKVLLVLGMVIYISSYLFTYFFDYPVYASESWAKQKNDAEKFAISKSESYKNIYIDGGLPWAIGYSYFSMLDPLIFQEAFNRKDTYGGIDIIKINNYSFGNFGLDNVSTPSAFFPKGSLVITNANSFPEIKGIREFKDPNGVRVIFKAIEVK